jgi:hypothetical protein
MKRPLYLLFRVIGPSHPSVVGRRTAIRWDSARDRREPADTLSVAHPPLRPRKWRLGADTAGFGLGVLAVATLLLRWEPVRASSVASVQVWAAHTNCCVNRNNVVQHFVFTSGHYYSDSDAGGFHYPKKVIKRCFTLVDLSNNAVVGGLWGLRGRFRVLGCPSTGLVRWTQWRSVSALWRGAWLGPQRAAGDAILRSLPVRSAGLCLVRASGLASGAVHRGAWGVGMAVWLLSGLGACEL